MSRIDELIERLCPDGVKFARVDELFDIRGGYTPSRSNAQYWSDGTIPWFRMEDIREYGRVLTQASQHVNESALKSSGLMPKGSIIIATSATIGEHAILGVSGLCNQRFTCLTKKPAFSERLDDKFLYYYCFALDEFCKKNLTQGSFASVSMPAFKSFKFPVPPMEIQEEIVRILDSFSELEAELEAELDNRIEQYRFFRNRLLNSDSLPSACNYKLDEVVSINKGTYITKKEVSPGNIPVVLGGTEPAYWHAKANHFGEGIVVSRSGANAGFVSYWNEPVFVSDGFVLDAKPGISLRYIFHALKNKQDKLHAMKRGSGVPHIQRKALSEFVISAPPLEEQRRIVSILDKFDVLVNDLSSGIPAEIAARRKQYEYYRDKLLTFKEKPGD